MTENPYFKYSEQFEPGHTLQWFEGIADLEASLAPKDQDWWVFGLIMQFDVPVLRRVLESVLVFDYGFDPADVTDTLDRLKRSEYVKWGQIIRSEVRLGHEPTPNHLYSCDRLPSDAEISALRSAYAVRSRILSQAVLGSAGERYVRALLRYSGLFKGITQQNRLGHVYDQNGQNKIDCLANSKQSGDLWAISVKNMREWLRADDKAIKDVVKRAHAHNAKPWLVVSFASARAIARCATSDIRLTVLGRQIVPAEDRNRRSMREFVERFRFVIGVMPFEYLYARPSRTIEESKFAKADLAALRRLEGL